MTSLAQKRSSAQQSTRMRLDKIFAPYEGVGANGEAKDIAPRLVGVSKLLSLSYEDFLLALSTSKVKAFLQSFLQNSERVWEAKEHQDSGREERSLATELSHGVFTIYYRLFFDLSASPAHLAKAWEGGDLLSAPDVLDLCSLFGPANAQSLRSLLEEAFQIRPQLLTQLADACATACEELAKATESITLDTVDLVLTLQSFYLSSEQGFQVLAKAIAQSSLSVSGLFNSYQALQSFLEKTEHSFTAEVLTAFLDIMHVWFFCKYFSPLNLLLEEEAVVSMPEADTKVSIEGLSNLLLSSIQDPEASEHVSQSLADYESVHELSKRFELAMNNNNLPGIDNCRENLQYLVGVLQTLDASSQALGTRFFDEETPANAVEVQGGDVDTEALVTGIKDILPHLGSYFIQRLLECSGYNAERAVQMVLEGNLPSELSQLDFSLESAPTPRVAQAKENSTPDLLEQKPQKPNDFLDVYNEFAQDGFDGEDGSENQQLKEKIRAAALKYSQYDDEYIDTYEDIDFDVGDDGGGAAKTWKPGMVDVDGKKRDQDGKEIKEDPNDLLKPNLNRAKKVPSVQADSDKPKAPGKVRQSGDPVDAKTARFKSKNKSRIGNHSRKRGAAKKQSKGMF